MQTPFAPEGAYTMDLSVRSYEVTASGTIGPGTLLRYLEHLATQASRHRGFDHAWYEQHGSAWVVREMSLRLRTLPGIDDELTLATWLSDLRRVQAFREYAIWRRDSGRLVARARARWAFVDRVRGQLLRIPDDLLTSFDVAGHAMPALAAGGAARDEHAHPPAVTHLRARHYEMDSQLHINNCVYLDWLDEALRTAVGSATPARTDVEQLCPRAYHIDYVAQTRAGDTVAIETRWQPRGTRALAATQALRDQAHVTLARARSLYLRDPRTGRLTPQPPWPPAEAQRP
jgi:acyl-CoA thioesterase FadM